MDLAGEPLVRVVVRAEARAGQPALDRAVAWLAVEAAAAPVAIDRQGDDIVIEGADKTDVESAVERLAREASASGSP